VIGDDRMADVRSCSDLVDGPVCEFSRCRGLNLTRFAIRGNDVSSSEKNHIIKNHYITPNAELVLCRLVAEAFGRVCTLMPVLQ